MLGLNIKDFLTYGAFLQTGPQSFKVIVGPFKPQNVVNWSTLKQSTLVFRPKFWDFLSQDQNNENERFYTAEHVYNFDREEFIGLLSTYKSEKPKLNWEDPDIKGFQEQFNWSQRHFLEKELTKTVPVIIQKATSGLTEENLIWSLQTLLKSNHFGWSYGYFQNGSGFLGHSPEVLVQWSAENSLLKTVALAGTYDNKLGAKEMILQDQKIIREHQIVIDDIKKKFSDLGLGSWLNQKTTQVLELKHLLHLKTDFEMQTTDFDLVLKLINKLHPTAAIGMFPYNPMKMQEFSQFEIQKSRQHFAAPFGMMDKNNILSIVAIRNLMFSKNEVSIFSGCGLTSDSQFEDEVLELKNKRESVKKMLGLS